MKGHAFIIAVLLSTSSAFGQTRDVVVSLDEAINGSMTYLTEHLAAGTKIAILNFAAAPAVSNYVIEELTTFIVNDGNLTVVDRSNLEMLRKEMNFQLSGEVSDVSAQAIGKKLGAQTIISGSLSPLGNQWRMRIKALEVETAKVQGVTTYTVKKDEVLANLLPKTTGEKVGTGALNILLGLGSYLEGDIAGGLTLTAGYAVTAGLFLIEATVLDWDSPAVGVPATLGVTVAGLTLAYGFLRPFIYKRSPRVVALLDNVHVGIVPTAADAHTTRRRLGLRLAHSLTF
jgi:TolB-like protein